MKNINTKLIENLVNQIDGSKKISYLQQIKLDLLGKNGLLTLEFKKIKSINPTERNKVIKTLTQLKTEIEKKISTKHEILLEEEISTKIKQEYIDVSLPGRENEMSKIHPISKVTKEILDTLLPFGFELFEGKSMDDQWHNFEALNMPKFHPSRQMQDTFYIDNQILLRTHTSNTQIRFMKDNKPPFKFLSYGRTYRHDLDSTHTPMFHQIEGVIVNEKINFSHMKFLLYHLIKNILGSNVKIRMRPSFFPFTSPSAEIDIKVNNEWIELLGCGMIHNKVFDNVGIDKNIFQGIAFGIGIERFTMIKYGIKDIRHFFEGNLKWNNHHGFSPIEVI